MEILKNNKIVFLIGLVWGLAFIFVFRNQCIGRKCIIVNRPQLKLIHEAVYEMNDGQNKKCYKIRPTVVPCPNDLPSITKI